MRVEDLIKGTKYEKEALRNKRKPILEAFDKYKANVEYGIEIEDGYIHEQIIAWYRSVLDLDANAIENIPSRIKYYMRGAK